MLTALSYIALVARDLSALSYIGVKVSTSALLLASFCGSALGNAVGNRALTAIAVRDRVYGAVGATGADRPGQVVQQRGIRDWAGSVHGHMPDAGGKRDGAPYPDFDHLDSMRGRGGAAGNRWRAADGRVAEQAGQAEAASIRGAVAGEHEFSFPREHRRSGGGRGGIVVPAAARRNRLFQFCGDFFGGTALGVISGVPGGLGVFEVVILMALRGMAPSNEIAAALLIYRGVYFIAPLLLAAAILAGFELRSASGRFGSKAAERLSVGAGLLAPTFLSAVTFAAGTMLVISGATPALDWRLAALQQVLPLWAVEISHLLATLAGVFLLFVARGLYHRLDGAWWLALMVALVNVVFSLTKGLAFGETAAMLFLLVLLLATRPQFTRRAAFMHQPFRLGWFVAIVAVMAGATGILLFAFRDVAYRHEIWWQFEFDAQASRSMRAILGASIFALGITLWQLMQAAPGG